MELQNTVKSSKDRLGCHTFICPKCQKEGFLGFWMNPPFQMKWFCSFCSEKMVVEKS